MIYYTKLSQNTINHRFRRDRSGEVVALQLRRRIIVLLLLLKGCITFKRLLCHKAKQNLGCFTLGTILLKIKNIIQ